jgi:AcrR family transcriptional regulator
MPAVAPQMRSKLAECALELFSQRGINNVNLDEVAAHAGVTKGSLYWHYKSKKDVVLAACACYYRQWQQRAHAEIAADNDPLGQLERVLRYSVQNCLLDRANRVFTTEIQALMIKDKDFRSSWAQFHDTVRELCVGLVQAACTNGQLKVANPRRAVDWMLASLEGIKQRATFEPEVCTPDERESMVHDLLRILGESTEK